MGALLTKFLQQGSTIVYVSAYTHIGICQVQGKNYKKLKKHKGYKSTSKTKPLFLM